MNPDTLLSDLEENTQKLISSISSFSQDNFNTRPSPASWSGADVAEHLLLLDSMIGKVLRGPVKPSDGQFDRKIKMIESVFTDTKNTFPAPEFILPSAEAKDLKDLAGKLITVRNTIAETIPGTDLSELCLEMKSPGFGALTRYEWIYFTIYHTNRHILQLNKINKGLTAS